ncbi:antiterminator Q family protein [Yersinia kristensenii]|uniref:Antitermination protein n=1 Tax=Yersinia kristensenii TaxID=28152 RepID=A0AB73QIG0_YERKR|nr:antiterminator Q family protein [Yersinia kristensenii]MDA5475011.1 antiterminator Q family protein [Yersinia kristensenii]MDA5476366.1 antiterminator Q family protein [Yersinia kristensenii]MDA5508094.1 antiterminator Q family protein [Yersinia kristensenii]MDA5524120.1 antiterminator Q family protein [Yersinia kristensenii]MDX6737729.1 antiterminator Q family protein [Yersinia kristensenii]
MSDIQTVLTRWGVWAREHSQLDYPHIASGFKGVATRNKMAESCCDNDGLAIDKTIGNLQRASREKELELILRHYVYGQSKASIARLKKCNEREIRRQLQVAESFIEGCITQSDISLEMFVG